MKIVAYCVDAIFLENAEEVSQQLANRIAFLPRIPLCDFFARNSSLFPISVSTNDVDSPFRPSALLFPNCFPEIISLIFTELKSVNVNERSSSLASRHSGVR